jgi:arylsulfatase A-like enzyme
LERNVIVFLIDGLRYDQIHGERKESFTPNIDSLIQKGTFFTNSYSCADGTILSLNTIFNSLFSCRTNNRARKILLEKNNIFDILKKSKYELFGLVPKMKIYEPLTKKFKNNESTYDWIKKNESLQTTLNSKIFELLEIIKKSPLSFTYIHLLDLHPLREGGIPNGLDTFQEEKYGTNNYSKTVSSIDSVLGKIFNQINLSDTSIILTSDHGERIPFGNLTNTDFEPKFDSAKKIGKKLLPKQTHIISGKILSKISKSIKEKNIQNSSTDLNNYQKRSRDPYFTLSLHDELLHVPLLFVGKNIVKKINYEFIRHVDLYPTILDLLGLDYNINDIDGKSFFPFENQTSNEELISYLHTMPYEKPHPKDSVGIRTKKYKYFHSENSKKDVYLYDLENDPFENNNIVSKQPELVNKFNKIITDIEQKKLISNELEFSDGEEAMIKEELRKLGYI